MKSMRDVTFIGSKEFTREFMGMDRHFIELNCIVHMRDGSMRAEKYVVTVDKLRKMLDYRGIDYLTVNKRYIFWLSDFKGDKKLKLNGIQEYKGL